MTFKVSETSTVSPTLATAEFLVDEFGFSVCRWVTVDRLTLAHAI